MTPEYGSVLGLDIGYSASKATTGACLLTWTGDHAKVQLNRLPTAEADRCSMLKKLLGHQRIVAAALDAPIRGGLDLIGEYRIAEMMLTLGFQRLIGKPGQASSGNGIKLNQSANDAARILIECDVFAGAPEHEARISDSYPIVEAFPTTFLGVLLDRNGVPPHGPRSDAYYDHLLGPDSQSPRPLASNRLGGLISRLLPHRAFLVTTPTNEPAELSSITHHDERAALVCAVTALCVAARSYIAVGDREDGYIVLPPRAAEGAAGLQPWAWDQLQKNCPRGTTGAIIEENS